MTKTREVERTLKALPQVDGAGVHLMRAFGHSEVDSLDPFLMLDDFHSSDPREYMAGFPMHPHRGIETVTYMLRGTMDHMDNIGNRGAIESGDVQWMTAGSGIVHQEMPRRYDGMMQGFQLWVNLPAAKKMMRPRYRGIKANDIPVFEPRAGVEVKVMAGNVDGTIGPVKDLVVEVEYLDVSLSRNQEYIQSVPKGMSAFAYVFEGSAAFGAMPTKVGKGQLAIFARDGDVLARAGAEEARFLLAAGRPLREPVAWGGPIVMNTDEELERAFEELRQGTFIKK